jgi:D-alanyl-D-alanine dipeptidase
MSQLVLVTAIGRGEGVVEAAAVEAMKHPGGTDGVPLLIEIGRSRRLSPTVLARRPAKELEEVLRTGFPESRVAARGGLCLMQVDPPADGRIDLGPILKAAEQATKIVVACAPGAYRQVAESPGIRFDLILLVCSARPDPAEVALTDLAVLETRELTRVVRVQNDPPGRLESRRALAGSAARGPRARDLRPAGTGDPASGGEPPAELQTWRNRLRAGLGGERAQATPLVLGSAFALVVGAVVLVAIAGAITGKGKAQRAADLAALSAARSMKDDLPRLLAPPTLPNGMPNPAHMPKAVYLGRARLTAIRIASANGASPLTASVRFPDALSFAPVTARVSVRLAVAGSGPTDPVWAKARVGAAVEMGAVPSIATGGGYSGPLAERQGHGMRPDVAAAFDRLAAAASGEGVTVTINSAFRSDAEQAALFAANPDPRWVAPPGTSLHRCGTELDLGPDSAYGWLAANAGRFGFVKRYSWEPWHFGFSLGPPPCSGAGNRVGSGTDRSRSFSESLPAFVPRRFRRAILASAMKWGVSAALLAAQLKAESGFDPDAVSPAGAQGIAQFMPETAASYGLGDPFDPAASIDAQGRLMSDLLKQFGGRPALALAAYNAGPGAVSPCDCIPDYPETQAYVAKILAMLGGIGSISPMPMEIELVD